ncbi:MAG: hypothetical protein Ct9H300mP26_2700 [Acidimicrobiales bacterium]|nr:MAG: hypothetical protein Ct9H300mP26_2700 [Acidimicrobiales bacterium]
MPDLVLERLLGWIDAAPSPYHAAHNAANDLVPRASTGLAPVTNGAIATALW